MRMTCNCPYCQNLRATNGISGSQYVQSLKRALTQYDCEALEATHGPKIWDPAAQDAIDDWRLINPRKHRPVATGVLAYFPDAILEVARVSEAGNRQHGTIGWDRSVSAGEFDALARHLIDHLRGNERDTDGTLHLAKVAWRALAALQRHLDATK